VEADKNVYKIQPRLRAQGRSDPQVRSDGLPSGWCFLMKKIKGSLDLQDGYIDGHRYYSASVRRLRTSASSRYLKSYSLLLQRDKKSGLVNQRKRRLTCASLSTVPMNELNPPSIHRHWETVTIESNEAYECRSQCKQGKELDKRARGQLLLEKSIGEGWWAWVWSGVDHQNGCKRKIEIIMRYFLLSGFETKRCMVLLDFTIGPGQSADSCWGFAAVRLQ